MAMKPLPDRLTALDVMQDAPVIPVIVLHDVNHAVPMARALVEGGIRMLEVTLRTPAALGCIERIAKEVPQAVVGAGTVRSSAEAQAAAKAGARFAVSPGLTLSVAHACQDAGLALLPGVATGSEIMMAVEAGYKELKFFPAMQAGGPAMLKAWSGPFYDVKFCPTGGVTEENATDFLRLPNVVCVGGSWLVNSEACMIGDWSSLTKAANRAKAMK